VLPHLFLEDVIIDQQIVFNDLGNVDVLVPVSQACLAYPLAVDLLSHLEEPVLVGLWR